MCKILADMMLEAVAELDTKRRGGETQNTHIWGGQKPIFSHLIPFYFFSFTK